MLKSLSVAALGLAAVLAASTSALAGDPAAGEKVFKKCQSCHAVGDGAQNKVGPELNELMGRVAGSVPDYKYSKAMAQAGADGLSWHADTLAEFLKKPRDFIKGTRMTFAGLNKQDDIDNVIAYLATFSSEPASADATEQTSDADAADAAPASEEPAMSAEAAPAPSDAASGEMAALPPEGAGAHFGLGRKATDDEVAAWNFDVRPDGLGLPEGHGTVTEGMDIYDENCAACHGDFGEGIGRWPVLAGGQGTLKDDRPVKTIGSYWPYLSTVYDYIHRAMPFGNARSLSDNDYYALTAYLLYLNDIVTDEDFELNKDNFTSIHLPNEEGFISDNRTEEAHYQENKGDPCMTDCIPGKAEITMHAAVLDVTPEGDDSDSGGGAID